MARSDHKIWQVEGNQLILAANGETQYPSADEVYRSVVEGEQVFAGVKPGPPENLDSLEFSPYPAELRLVLTSESSQPGARIACRVMAYGENDHAELKEFDSRRCDHVVIGNTWHPFAVGIAQEIKAILEDAQVGDPKLLDLRQFLNLKRQAAKNPFVKDETVSDVFHLGQERQPADDDLSLFAGSLYPYQLDGYRWLSFICQENLGGILADEMGLGKTVQIIAAFAKWKQHQQEPNLVIAPSTLLENWRREIVRFAPSLKICVHQGPNRTGLPDMLRNHDVTIASYDTVVRDSALFEMVRWGIVAVDEAQAIKNPETRRANSVKQLKRRVAFAVTGTPFENRLRDVWSLVDFILPGYLGTEREFEEMFGNDESGASAIEPFVSPLLLRRHVADVAKDLPDRIDVPQVLVLKNDEIGCYEAHRLAILEEYGMSASLVALTKLRMFCAHPWLLDETTLTADDPAAYGKFKRLLEILEEVFANGEKVLVFTSFNRMSDLIVGETRKRFRVYADFVDGRVPITNRQETVDEFTALPGPGVLVLNPRAAGTGLNIAAANHVIHYNLEWNPAVEDQASARAYRRGQEKPVTIHRLWVANTVEEAIHQRLGRKRALADAAIVGVSGKQEDIDDIAKALQFSPATEVAYGPN